MFKKSFFVLFFLIIYVSGCTIQEKKNNIGGGYFLYQNKIYLNSTGLEVQGADPGSFQFLYEDLERGEGPHTFAKDKNAVYGEFWVLFTGFDYTSLTGAGECLWGCFKDKEASYYRDGCPGDARGCIYKKDTGFFVPYKNN